MPCERHAHELLKQSAQLSARPWQPSMPKNAPIISRTQAMLDQIKFHPALMCRWGRWCWLRLRSGGRGGRRRPRRAFENAAQDARRQNRQRIGAQRRIIHVAAQRVGYSDNPLAFLRGVDVVDD